MGGDCRKPRPFSTGGGRGSYQRRENPRSNPAPPDCSFDPVATLLVILATGSAALQPRGLVQPEASGSDQLGEKELCDLAALDECSVVRNLSNLGHHP